MVRALRVARLRTRIRRQPLSATIRDALQILRPSVLKAANLAIRAWARAPGAIATLPGIAHCTDFL
jgi:hypothetical protein